MEDAGDQEAYEIDDESDLEGSLEGDSDDGEEGEEEISEIAAEELEELAELEKLEALGKGDIENLANKEEPKIGKKRKREQKELEYEFEREDLNPKQKIAEKISSTKRRATSKSTAGSDKTVDF